MDGHLGRYTVMVVVVGGRFERVVNCKGVPSEYAYIM